MTTQTTDATSADIGTYNTFVQTSAASGHSDIQGFNSEFRALISTEAVDARDNTATNLDGILKVPIRMPRSTGWVATTRSPLGTAIFMTAGGVLLWLAGIRTGIPISRKLQCAAFYLDRLRG